MRLKARYFNAGDRMDMPAIRACFTDDAVVDFPSFQLLGGPDDMVAAFAAAAEHNPAVNIHHGHNPEIEILDENTARGVWNLYFVSFSADGTSIYHNTGLYADEYRRTDKGWLMSRTRTDIRVSMIAPVAGPVQVVVHQPA